MRAWVGISGPKITSFKLKRELTSQITLSYTGIDVSFQLFMNECYFEKFLEILKLRFLRVKVGNP